MKGILNVYKEKNMTSHDVVAIVRGVSGIKRVGHTGTLDPLVTGVLPVCLGQATKLADYISEQGKCYEGALVFGQETDSLDLEGQVCYRSERTSFSPDQIRSAMADFTGPIAQLPPMYSAVKHQGKRLYELARAGKTVERKRRNVEIYAFDLLEVTDQGIRFFCHCSKGTYIRQLVADLGRHLGSYATMTALERTAVGPFRIEDAVPISRLRVMTKEALQALLVPMEEACPHLPRVDLDRAAGQVARHGGRATWPEALAREEGLHRIFDPDGFIGLGYYQAGAVQMKKVLTA